MKCQNCGKFEANCHYSSNINGNITEQHLCSECAEKTGYNEQYFRWQMREFGGLFSEMLGGMRGFWPSFGINMPVFVSAPPQMGILEKSVTQNVAPAVPDTTAAVDEEMNKRREINVLREEMRMAAEREDYERAIELREELRKYES